MLEPVAPGLAVTVWVPVYLALEAAAVLGRVWNHLDVQDDAVLIAVIVRHLVLLLSIPPSALVVQSNYEQTVYKSLTQLSL